MPTTYDEKLERGNEAALDAILEWEDRNYRAIERLYNDFMDEVGGAFRSASGLDEWDPDFSHPLMELMELVEGTRNAAD